MRLRSRNNPAFRFGNFTDTARIDRGDPRGGMTLDGALGKTAFLLLITTVSAGVAWQQAFTALIAAQKGVAVVAVKQGIMQTAMYSGIGSAIIGMATCFKPNWAPWSAPLYAACKGFFLGALSFTFELYYPGIVTQSVCATLGTAGGLLALMKTGAISLTERMRSTIVAGLVGVMVSYLGIYLLSLLGVRMAFLAGGPIGIAFSCVTAGVAAAVLLLDFDNLEKMEYAGTPRWMEWYGGFSVLVTLLWLYAEILNLLAKLRGSGSGGND